MVNGIAFYILLLPENILFGSALLFFFKFKYYLILKSKLSENLLSVIYIT